MRLICTSKIISITFSAIYCPLRHTIKSEQFMEFFNSLGNRFVTGGDYNAKNVRWGSRLTLLRGRKLLHAINILHLNAIPTGEPTYWPSNPKKLPDLIDFSITKGISSHYIKCVSCLELSSDHSRVLITLNKQILASVRPSRLHNRKTNRTIFREIVKATLDLNIPLKTDDNIMKAVEHFNKYVQSAAWDSTPANQDIRLPASDCPPSIREEIAEKRKLRKQWQNRCPTTKRRLNHALHSI